MTGEVSKPLQVARAVTMLWGSLAIGVVISLLDWQYLSSVASIGFTVTVLGIVFVVTAFLVSKISGGRNWARITLLVLVVFGAVSYVPNLVAMFGRSVLTGSLSLAQLALQVGALFLLFTRPGADWFGRKPPA